MSPRILPRFALLGAFMALWALSACGPAVEEAPPGDPANQGGGKEARERGCVEDFDPEVDLYPQKVAPRWAERFRVEYHGYYKILEIQGAAEPLRFALVRCGAPHPGLDTHPGLDMPIIEVPIRTVATTSTTELPPLEALGQIENWVAHADLRYVSSENLRAYIDGGGVAEIGGADGIALDLERLLEISPDLLLVDSVERTGGDRLKLLEEVGTLVVPTPSYRETSPLGRTEWLLMTALFFDLEAEAQELFTEIEASYLALRDRVAASEAKKPTVVTSGPWQGVWHIPGGESFMAHLLADAGGDFLWSEAPGVGPLMLDIEWVYERAGEADIWLYPSHWRSLDEIAGVDERLAAFGAFKNRRIYAPDLRLTGSGGNDYWELGVFRPDLVLADLVAIFHPELLPDHQAVFHRRLEQEAP